MKSSSWNLSFSWNSAKEIFSATDQLIQKTLSRHNTIATLPKLQYSFDSVFSLLALAENEFKAEADAIQFMKYVSDSKEVRDASQVATQKLDEFEIEASMRRDLYEVLCATSSLVDRTQLSLEDQRYMDRWLMDCKRNGLHLPSQQQDEVKALKKKIALLCTQFSCTKNADTTCLTLTHDELDGLPDSYFASLTPGSTSPTPTYKITMSYPDRLPILRKAKRETTRQRLYQTIHTMCPDNVQVLNTLIELRHQVAQLLGYATHADYILEPKMAKSAQAVHDFLLDLQTQLTPLGKKEYQRLLLLKNKERKEKGLDPVSELYQWDFNYYHTQLMETTYNVDQEAIKPYFSMEAVTQGMLKLYSTILGITITQSSSLPTWHPDVTVYDVTDTSSTQYLGSFYLDLYPREGTYKHAAVFTLRPTYQCSATQSWITPICAMKANFTKPTATTPSLLNHDEVVTYFHELGHVMHCILSKTKYARFHGTNVARDFVEAPSQMFENWCWEPSVLRSLSSHYLTQEKLPDPLLDSLIQSQHVNEALHQLRQLFFGMFDMHVHTHAKVDTTQVFNTLRDQITLLSSPHDTFGQATFDHLTGGYDAGYYGYLWSKVFSSDMYFSKFHQSHGMDPTVGQLFRKQVLFPGGSVDEMSLIESFLGRPPNPHAFLKSIGLGDPKEENKVLG